MSNPALNPASCRKEPILFSNRILWLAAGCSALLLWSGFQLDATVLDWVSQYSKGWSRWLARQVSLWGDWYGIVAIGLLGWWQARRTNARQWKKLWLIMGICGALGGLGANVVRALSGRARPNGGVTPGWYGPAKGMHMTKSAHAFQSFPSAHTGVVAGFCAPLGLAALRTRRSRTRILGVGISLSGTALMCWSRVWVGAHYLSDVLAASLPGWGIALLWLRFRAPELNLDPEGPDVDKSS